MYISYIFSSVISQFVVPADRDSLGIPVSVLFPDALHTSFTVSVPRPDLCISNIHTEAQYDSLHVNNNRHL